jgi:serine/threonine protein kinase
MRYALAEKHILEQSNCPFIVDIYTTLHNEDSLFFILEYCGGGTLKDLLNKIKRMSELQAKYSFKFFMIFLLILT